MLWYDWQRRSHRLWGRGGKEGEPRGDHSVSCRLGAEEGCGRSVKRGSPSTSVNKKEVIYEGSDMGKERCKFTTDREKD